MLEFECFIKTLLSEVQPKRMRHKQLVRGQEPISKCFAASDKAFVMTVLDNKLHVEDQQAEKKTGLS